MGTYFKCHNCNSELNIRIKQNQEVIGYSTYLNKPFGFHEVKNAIFERQKVYVVTVERPICHKTLGVFLDKQSAVFFAEDYKKRSRYKLEKINVDETEIKPIFGTMLGEKE